jgi:16S rRNA U516 pseudouridylate synthase RsuA-like enzyme
VGGKVVTLVRVSIGPVETRAISPREAVRALTAREVRALLRAGSEER